MPDFLAPAPQAVMHDSSQPAMVEVVIPSDLVVARQLQDEIERALNAGQFLERDVFCIKLALEEALVNAIKHGNQADRSKKVHVRYRIEPGRFEVHIRDEGPGFNPEDVPDPLDVANLERPCGRGLLLMRHYMNDVVFHAPGNYLSMVKLRSSSSLNGHA